MKNILSLLLLFFFVAASGQKISLIIDADTGNEMDDLYAIVKAVQDENCEVTGLISAHFNNVQLLTDEKWNGYSTENINTLQISQELNEQLLNVMGATGIPHPAGCDKMVGYAWGYYPGAPIPGSEGVDFIIQHAKNASKEAKLSIAVLGAVTNVASAILTDPEIAPKLRVYLLNMKYDFEKKAWNKNSFNARNDINGLDILLNTESLELIIMPGTVARQLTFRRDPTTERLDEDSYRLDEILEERWDHVNADETWIMWDLALIQAIIYPHLATLETTQTPPENTWREIGIYTDIDEAAMREEFWRTYRSQ